MCFACVLLLVSYGQDGAEHAYVVEVAGHPLASCGGLGGPAFVVGALDLRVEGDAFLDEHLEAGLALVGEGDRVANLSFDRDIGDEALAADGIDTRHASRVGVAVGVAVFDVDEEDVVVLAGGVQVRIGHEKSWRPSGSVAVVRGGSAVRRGCLWCWCPGRFLSWRPRPGRW